MSDVFISYAKEDQAGAKILVDVLTEQGWSVWWDHEIPPGKTWDEAIGKEINAASCVIVLWSKASVASKWVFNEAMKGKERKILLPVLIEEGVEIPPEFGLIQATDFTGWDGQTPFSGLDPLLKQVRALLAKRVRRRIALGAGILIILAVVAFFFLQQQDRQRSHDLSGVVVEVGTGTPIAKARVVVQGGLATTTTNAQGMFRIAVPRKRFERVEVTVSLRGYESKTLRLALAEGQRIALKRKQR